MPSPAPCFRRPTCRTLLLGGVSFLLITLLSFLSLGRTLENQALDLAYRLQPHRAPPESLLIVAIDEPSLREIHLPWPWPRQLHAALVERLRAAGARLIIFDLLFSEPGPDPEGDRLLAGAMLRAGNVLLAETYEVAEDRQFSRRFLIQPVESLRRAAWGLGLSMVTPDEDGVVRRFCCSLGGRPTLPAMAVQFCRGPTPLPPGPALIDFVGPPRSVEIVSYYRLLEADNPFPLARVKDRVVWVGRVMETQDPLRKAADALYTPFFASSGQFMAGVEIQAQICHTLLQGTSGRELPPLARVAVYLGLFLAAGLGFSRLTPTAGLAILAGAVAILWGTSVTVFGCWRWWLPPLLPSVGLTLVWAGHALSQYLLDLREKRWLRQAFSRYLSPRVIELLTADPKRLELGGEEMEVTVLFADLAGFTALSEEMPPPELVRTLNEFLTPMTRVILECGGTLDKYIGDGLMALWGAPLPAADHAVLACRAALKMQEEFRLLQVGWRIRGLTRLEVRLGLHSGPVVAGNVGSKERLDYTVLGDTVNLAARLETVNKVYGTRIIISEATRQQLPDTFLVRELDRVQVRGREGPVTIFELLGRMDPHAAQPPWLSRFAAGRQAYLHRDWHRAGTYFQEVLSLKKGDRPAQIFLARCREYEISPPAADWNGLHVVDGK